MSGKPQLFRVIWSGVHPGLAGPEKHDQQAHQQGDAHSHGYYSSHHHSLACGHSLASNISKFWKSKINIKIIFFSWELPTVGGQWNIQFIVTQDNTVQTRKNSSPTCIRVIPSKTYCKKWEYLHWKGILHYKKMGSKSSLSVLKYLKQTSCPKMTKNGQNCSKIEQSQSKNGQNHPYLF